MTVLMSTSVLLTDEEQLVLRVKKDTIDFTTDKEVIEEQVSPLKFKQKDLKNAELEEEQSVKFIKDHDEQTSKKPLPTKVNKHSSLSDLDEPGLKLVQWFKSIVDDSFELQTLMNEDFKAASKSFFDDCNQDKFVNTSLGLSLNNEGQIEGQGIAEYKSDAKCRQRHGISFVNGKFINGALHGRVIFNFTDGSYSRAHFKHGLLDGLYVHFSCKFGPCDQFELEAWRKPRHLHKVSVFKKGHQIGISYEFKRGGGFMVGSNNFTGSDVAYVYPDMKTMLVGNFSKGGVMMSAQEAEITGLEMTFNGLLKPKYIIKGHDIYSFSLSNQTSIGKATLLRDPMEDKYVYIANSTLPGDVGRGVFLKSKARKGFTVSFYNGVRMSDIESKLKVEDRKSPYRMDNDWAKPKEVLNIPKQYRSLDAYNATLGHLVNHSNKPNTWFGMIDHPRFGPIRSIVLLEDLEAGQELFADYGYLEQYAQSETAIKSIYHILKWYMNESDEDFHKTMKHHIKYLRTKVSDYKPYLSMLKGFSAGFSTGLLNSIL